LFFAHPLIFGGAAWLWLRRDRLSVRASIWQMGRAAFALSALIALAVVYIGVIFFAEAPLPWLRAGFYYVDMPWHLSLAADALHHYPVADPHIAGEPFNYYWFLYFHLAASAFVTRIGLTTITLRLFIVPMLAAMCVQAYVLGRSLGARVVGLMAVVLIFFVGELDPFAQVAAAFQFENAFPYFLYASPTLTMSLVVYLPLLIVVSDWAQMPFTLKSKTSIGHLLLISLLLVACAGSKVTTLTVAFGGLVGAAVWALIWRRGSARALLIVCGITLIVVVAAYTATFSKVSGGLSIKPFASVQQMFFVYKYLWLPVTQVIKNPSPLAGALILLAITPLALIGHMGAHLVGIAYSLIRTRLRLSPTHALLLMQFLCGLAAFLLISGTNYGQKYFMYAAYVPGCVVGAYGLWLLWQRLSHMRAWVRRMALIAVSGLIFVGALDAPLDNLAKLRDLAHAQPLAVPTELRMTPAAYAGFAWVRDHSQPDDVVAVTTSNDGITDAGYF
jgi:hypothetical protein